MSIDQKSAYYDEGGIETIDIIQAKLNPEQFLGFLLGNIVKYSSRLNYKTPEDRVRDGEKVLKYSEMLPMASLGADIYLKNIKGNQLDDDVMKQLDEFELFKAQNLEVCVKDANASAELENLKTRHLALVAKHKELLDDTRGMIDKSKKLRESVSNYAKVLNTILEIKAAITKPSGPTAVILAKIEKIINTGGY